LPDIPQSVLAQPGFRMLATSASFASDPSRAAPQRSFREVCQTAIRVFDLMGKYKTAPYPHAYAVFFAYVSGSDENLMRDVNDLLQLKEQLSPYDIESLYQEYLASESGTFAIQDIGQAIGDEISAVRAIIEKGMAQTGQATTTLDALAGQSPQEMSGAQLAAVVTGLLYENQRIAEITRQLNQGLAASQELICALNTQLEDIQTQSQRDPATALLNRRAFDKRVEDAAAKAEKTGERIAVVRAQIDNLGSVREVYGALAEEQVIADFAALLATNLADGEQAARYGSEDFAVLLKGKELMSAYNFAVKIKHLFKSSRRTVEGSDAVITGVTASFGVRHLEAGMTAAGLIDEAEIFLRDAQAAGRNLVKAPGIG
jgi:diguanylate cyclase